MIWTVEILRKAQKQLAALTKPDQDRISGAILELAENPRPPGCKKLRGRPGWRIRVGDHRVLYEIHDGRLLVVVVEVGNRKGVYR